jgi:serine protease Do
MKKTQFKLFLLVSIFLLPVLACGAITGDNPVAEPTTEPAAPTAAEPEPTTPPADTPTETPLEQPVDGAISNLQDVEDAVVRIVARGTFVDPEVGLRLNAAGSGTGFIIDESGIAVTNNHVVTGAATLEVFVGEETSPRNARILAVSECSDLAVIDIEGEGFPYLEWYDGIIDVGLDIYAAGFPLGDPEYTLTRGIVSKQSADGDTPWASVDEVLQHDATINPGNSGGPLVDENGKVVGVNYAGTSDTNQYFAIARDEALAIIDRLRNGEDVTSIGINGTAVTDGDSIFGIWVSSVESGSPADNARIKAGDIVTAIEDLVLATDGTMADYCDILRTRGPQDTMDVQVLRFATNEFLEGQLNGRELEVTVNFGMMLDEDVADDPGGPNSGYEYTTITDESGLLIVEVPTVWTDINGDPWASDGEEIGVAVSAAPDLEGFNTTWTTPGVFFGASSQIEETPATLIDNFDYSSSCTYDGRRDYEDPLYTGLYDLWVDCDDQGTLYLILSAEPDDQSFIILVTVQIVTEADLDALDHILDTFLVDV